MTQAVLASAGTESKSAGLSLSWTLGETAVLSRATPRGFLTEGLHQPSLVIHTLADLPDFLPTSSLSTFSWQVYPNPTADVLSVRFADKAIASDLQVYDAHGRLAISRSLVTDESTLELDFGSYAPGIYWLVARDAQGQVLQSLQCVKL